MKILYLILFYIIINYSTGDALTLIEHKYDIIKGVQVFNLNFKRSELDTFLATVKNNGFNTIFLRVFHNEQDRYHFLEESSCKSGVYFQTKKLCVVNNVLDYFIERAHSYHLKVYAWMATRSLSALKDVYGIDKTFTINGAKRDGYGLNIFNEKAFSDIVELFKELASYKLDGILIQDDLILKYDESASAEALKRFYVDTGINLAMTHMDKNIADKFAEWKVKQLKYFLSKIVWDVKYLNPALKIALNIYYETPLYIDNAKKWYAQSLDDLKDTGVDYFAFMSYHKQIEEENNLEFYDAVSLINDGLKYLIDVIEPDSRVIAKFQIKSFPDKKYINKLEFKQLCDVVNSYNKIGVIVLPVDDKTDLKYSCENFRR